MLVSSRQSLNNKGLEKMIWGTMDMELVLKFQKSNLSSNEESTS